MKRVQLGGRCSSYALPHDPWAFFSSVTFVQAPLYFAMLVAKQREAPMDNVAELVRYIGKCSRALTWPETRQAHRLYEVGRALGERRLAQVVARSGGGPCLQSNSADGTPIQASSAARGSLPSGTTVWRSGKATHEFLAAAQFVRTEDPAGAVETGVDIRDPRPLTNGKKAEHIFESCKKIWKSLRQRGHNGPVVGGLYV